MTDVKTAIGKIESFIRPATFPVGVRMLESGDEIPERAKRPRRDMSVEITTCQAVTMARKYGWTVALTTEDINCPLTKIAFGLEKEPAFFKDGNCCAGMYTESAAAGARTETETYHFPYNRYKGILMAPAGKAAFEPQVVIVYANPAQVMRLVTGALWKQGGAIKSSFTGRIDCSDEIIRPIETGDYEVVLPCYGDRVFGQTEDHEMAFSFPWPKIDELIEGLEGTHKGGVRYPIPSFLRYSGEFPPSYNKLDEIWEEEKA